jgi:hypothetical protein
MILDISLTAVRRTEVFGRNITHNLVPMAKEAGLYLPVWHPEQPPYEIKDAADLAPLLQEGLRLLKSDPERFLPLEPANKRGTYSAFVEFVQDYLDACIANPDAKIHASP